MAQELGLPFVYVRSEPKGHGLGNTIEGDLSVMSNCVVVEDLVSTGGSSLKAVQALREAGVEVKGMVAIFTYGFPEAKQAFRGAGCPLFTLTDYPTLLEQATAEGYLDAGSRQALEGWSADPKGWSDAHS